MDERSPVSAADEECALSLACLASCAEPGVSLFVVWVAASGAFFQGGKATLIRRRAMVRRLSPYLCLSLVILAARPGVSQVQGDSQSSVERDSGQLLVTAAAGKEQVRFTALGLVRGMHLEVLNHIGDTVYSSEFHAGSVLDWKIEDQAGRRQVGTWRQGARSEARRGGTDPYFGRDPLSGRNRPEDGGGTCVFRHRRPRAQHGSNDIDTYS